MLCADRYEERKNSDLDEIIILIRKGDIKCGKYAHLVKVDKDKQMKGKEFFSRG